MKAVVKGPWGADEDATLAELAADGVPPKAIASRLGRSVNSVYARMSRFGIKSLDQTRWTAEDDGVLRRMASGGMGASSIGACLGRSENAVRIRMHKLGVRSGLRHRYDWASVERMLSDGASVQEAAASEGVTVKKLRSAFLGRNGMTVSEWVKLGAGAGTSRGKVEE